MNSSTKPLPPQDPITAADLARLIRRLAKLYDTGDLGNVDTADALVALAGHLQSIGPIPVADLEARRRTTKEPVPMDRDFVHQASVGDIREMLSGDLSKSRLVELANLRFGMPAARLRRMPIDQVIEAIMAAAAHEESLDIIERNAESSGRARSS